MPYRKKRTYKKKKKVARRRKAYMSRHMGSPSGMPAVKLARLRYSQRVAVVSSTTIGTYVFRANSCFDPDYTGAGHQPMGFDEWSALYNSYTVLGSKINASWMIGSNRSCIIGIHLSDGPAPAYTAYSSYIESRKGTHKVVSDPDRAYRTVSKFSAKRFFNVSDVKDNDELSAAVADDPSKLAYYVLWSQDEDGSSSLTNYVLVTIDYIVAFRNPKDLIPS